MIVAGYYGFTLVIRVSVCPDICCMSNFFFFFFFLFLNDNLSKIHWIFTELGVCIDIMEIWFGIA